MSEPRVIKKYPNRRLYDTAESRYITLNDVKRLVHEGIGFIVIDRKDDTDITRNILLQVIADEEGQGSPVLSCEFLTRVIRTYNGSPHEQIRGHLEESMRSFVPEPVNSEAARRLASRPLP